MSAPPLPPVERVRPRLWSIPVPLPLSSLRHVFVYLFETDRGAYLVDAGWNTDEAFAALGAGLQTAGYSMSDVRGVLTTHVHPDHYGLAGRVREASGAWLALHPADAALVHDFQAGAEDTAIRLRSALRAAGAPAAEVESVRADTLTMHGMGDHVEPDVLLEDGDRPDVPGWEITAVWTPGHSPGHLCFDVPTADVVITGDHVLPKITPHISVHASSGADPLRAYLGSLEKIAAHDRGGLVLPAHEYHFTGLRERVAAIRSHHEHRLDEVEAIVDAGASTTWEVASSLTWSRPWNKLDATMHRAAVGEALAHLRSLEGRDRVAGLREGGSLRWVRATSTAAPHDFYHDS